MPGQRQSNERDNAASGRHGNREVGRCGEGRDIDRPGRLVSREPSCRRLSAQRRSHRVRTGRARALRERLELLADDRSSVGARATTVERRRRERSRAGSRWREHDSRPIESARHSREWPGHCPRREWNRGRTRPAIRDARGPDTGGRSSRTRSESARSRGRGRRAPAAARLLDGGTHAGRFDHRQHGQSRPRHAQRSSGGDWPRRVRSSHR